MQESFQNYINAAIDCYVQDRQGKVSQERLNDIANIKKILGTAIPDESYYKQILSNYLNKMRTGWFVFQTGNSKLKQSIQAKFKEYKNARQKVYLSPNGNIQLSPKEIVKSRKNFHKVRFFPNWNISVKSINKNTAVNKEPKNYFFRFER